MKTALVTGSSRGIGRAIAIKLAQDGFKVYINYVSDSTKAEEVQKIIKENGGECELVKCDLTSINCAEDIAKVIDSLDALVLNASIQYRNSWDKITMEEFDTQINCNWRSSLLLIQKFMPKMVENGWGRVITIGSVQERKPHPDMLVYSSTKAALTLMAQSLALQVANTGVTVNSVAPGVINTDRNEKALSDAEYAKQVMAKIPMNRCGLPEDCSGIVSFLCSDDASYITGQNIFVDGGMGIK